MTGKSLKGQSCIKKKATETDKRNQRSMEKRNSGGRGGKGYQGKIDQFKDSKCRLPTISKPEDLIGTVFHHKFSEDKKRLFTGEKYRG